MQGIVFLEFLDMAAGRFGADAIDRALELAGLASGGEYDEAESYDARELPRLAGALAKLTGRSASDLLRAFGRHLFVRLVEGQPALTEAATAAQRWARLGTMLPPVGLPVQAAKGTGLPVFAHRETDEGRLEVRYDVAKALADLADEFVVAASERLGPAAVKDVSSDGTNVQVRLLIE